MLKEAYGVKRIIIMKTEPGACHHEQTMNICSDLLTGFLFCSIIHLFWFIDRLLVLQHNPKNSIYLQNGSMQYLR